MKKFFQKIGLFLAKLLGGLRKFEKFLVAHVDDAIAIGKKILEYTGNPVLIGLLELLPDKLKDKSQDVIDKIEKALILAIDDVAIAKDCLSKPTTEEKLLCFINAIKNFSPHHRDAVISKLVSRMVANHSDVKVKQSVIDTIVQNRFFDQKHQLSATA